MPIDKELAAIFAKYALHPDFLGNELNDANQRGGFDDALLHIATRKGELKDIEVLVSHGADINLPGDLGNTPLHNAALTGQAASAEKLIALGADPKLINEFEQTPLDVALLGNHQEVASVLRKAMSRKRR